MMRLSKISRIEAKRNILNEYVYLEKITMVLTTRSTRTIDMIMNETYSMSIQNKMEKGM